MKHTKISMMHHVCAGSCIVVRMNRVYLYRVAGLSVFTIVVGKFFEMDLMFYFGESVI